MNEPSKEKERDASETIIEKVESPPNTKRKTEVVHGDYGIDQVNIDESLYQGTISKKKIKVNVEIKKENLELCDINTKDNGEGVKQMSAAPDGTKKPDAHGCTNEIDQANNDKSLKRKKISNINIIPDKEIKKEPAETCDISIRNNFEGVEQTSIAPDWAKKVPSRSAMRKKVKRKWTQELVNISQNICKKKIIPIEKIKKEYIEGDQLETHDKVIRDDVEGVGQSSTAPNGAKKVPSRSARRKKEKRRWKQKVAKISQHPETHEYTNEIGQANNYESFTQKKISQQKIIPNEEIKKEDTETCDKNIRNNVKGVEQTSTALDGAKNVPNRSATWKRPNGRRRRRMAKISQNRDTHDHTNEIDQANNDESLPRKNISKIKGIVDKEIKKEPAETCDINIGNSYEGVEQASLARAGAKKVPSRSARRKKAKRRWKQEVTKISRNPDTHDYTNETGQANNDESLPQKNISEIKLIPDEEIKKEPAETCGENIRNNVEGDEQLSLARAGAKKVPSRSAMRKKAKQNWRQELAKISQNFKMPANVVHINIMEQEERNRNDGDEKQIKLPAVALRWTGITKKRKGPKWGLEKFSTFERDDLQKTTKESSSVLTVDTRKTLIHLIEFDHLPLCNSPKKGDVIAYRILELSSSSLTPELSSIRVGKISYYDGDNIVLMLVPEYPMVFDKMDPNNSLYKEDGSLVIKFAALADVRTIERSDSDVVKAVSDGVDPTPQGGEKNAASNLMSNSNDDRANLYKDPSPVVDNRDGNAWAEIDKLLSAKKSELLEVNQEMKKDPGGIKWSYRGSALGPTMALLRSKNYI